MGKREPLTESSATCTTIPEEGRRGKAMNRSIRHKFLMWLVAALLLTATGCSVFINTPQVARFHIQQLDDRFVEVVINLDTPTETDLDIHLNNRYTLQLEFEWLWGANEESTVFTETFLNSEEPQLSPWMLCKYRF